MSKGGILMSEKISMGDSIDVVLTKLKIKKIKFALSEDQMIELLKVALNLNYKHYLMIRTQLDCGLRVGELANLRIESVNFPELEIFIEAFQGDRYCETWNPKTISSNRVVPLDEGLSIELKKFIQKKTKGYLFESQKGTKFDEKSIIRFINMYAKKCRSLNRTIGSHALRRTFASVLSKNNIPIGTISKLLGHKDIKTTFLYLYQIEDRDFSDVRRVIKNKMGNKK